MINSSPWALEQAKHWGNTIFVEILASFADRVVSEKNTEIAALNAKSDAASAELAALKKKTDADLAALKEQVLTANDLAAKYRNNLMQSVKDYDNAVNELSATREGMKTEYAGKAQALKDLKASQEAYALLEIDMAVMRSQIQTAFHIKLEKLRRDGWSVASHTDIGCLSAWGMVKNGTFLQATGASDDEALGNILAQIEKLPAEKR